MKGFEAMLRRMGGEGLFKVGEEEAFEGVGRRAKGRNRGEGGGEVGGFPRFEEGEDFG